MKTFIVYWLSGSTISQVMFRFILICCRILPEHSLQHSFWSGENPWHKLLWCWNPHEKFHAVFYQCSQLQISLGHWVCNLFKQFDINFLYFLQFLKWKVVKFHHFKVHLFLHSHVLQWIFCVTLTFVHVACVILVNLNKHLEIFHWVLFNFIKNFKF